MPSILYAGATDIGRVRKTNQDAIGMMPEHFFFAVADGMGGHNGGDIASQMTIKIFSEFVSQNFQLPPREILTKGIQHINQSIYQKAQQEPELKGMGTTIVALLFSGQELYLGNVGDSRTYMINQGQIYQLTKDHSFVQEKLNLGFYNRQEAAKDKQKNVLIRSVGIESEILVDVYVYKIHKNDIFLICSDGLHGKVSDKDILYIINKNIPNPQNATQNQLDQTVSDLITQANINGGQDNISVILTLAKE